MQYKKRKANGRFRSKRESERLFNIHSMFVIATLFTPLGLVLAFAQDTVSFQAPQAEFHIEVVEVAEAHEVLPVEKAIQDIPHESPKTTEVIKYIYEQAPLRNINPDQITHTIYCESMFYNIQSGVVHKGVREPSYGLAQIHLPSHPKVTVEQALDPYFAVDWMMEHWDTAEWYGYDRESDSCNNDITEYWN